MNVVFVTIDSLRADHVGCYGYDRDTTPCIDRLADDGVALDAFANANATRASFPAILTSTYPLAYGGFEYLSDRRTPLAEPFQSAGYATGGFHSNVWLSRDFNYDRGFDTFYDSKSEPGPLARLRSFLKTALDQDGRLYGFLQRVYDTVERDAGIDIGQTYKDAETITDRALAWVWDVDRPFFLWVHYMDVHHPYVPRPDYATEMGYDLDIGNREAIRLRRKMLERPAAVTAAERQTLVDLYDAEIRYADEHVGRLLDSLEDETDEMTVLLTSDHGEEFGEHGQFSHNPSMYEEILHVPLVLGGAGAEGVGPSDTEVELLDVPPTMLDLAGVEGPDSYEGRSVLERLADGAAAAVISETENEDGLRLSIRRAGWKYIWDQGAGTEELYDLGTDPGETDNLLEESRETLEEESSQRAELRATLEEHVEDLKTTNERLPDVRMDAETERRLKDLGYLE